MDRAAASTVRAMCLRPLLRVLAAHLLLLASLQAQKPATPAGEWSGAIDLPGGQRLEVRVALKNADGAWRGTIDIPAQGLKSGPLEKIAVDGSHVTFAIGEVGGEPTFLGDVTPDGTAIAGTFAQSGQTFPFRLTS